MRGTQSQGEDPGDCGNWAAKEGPREQGSLSLSSREASLSKLCKLAEEHRSKGNVGGSAAGKRLLRGGGGAHSRGCPSQGCWAEWMLLLLPVVVRNTITQVPGPCNVDSFEGCALSALLSPRHLG